MSQTNLYYNNQEYFLTIPIDSGESNINPQQLSAIPIIPLGPGNTPQQYPSSQFIPGQSNINPQQLSVVPIVPIGPGNTPQQYPPFQFNPGLSNINPQQLNALPIVPIGNAPQQYPPSQFNPGLSNINPQQLNTLPVIPLGPVPPVPIQDISKHYPLGMPNISLESMKTGEITQGNMINPIQTINPLNNQPNFIQYNIFPQAINQYNSNSQSFLPGMNLMNNINTFNDKIIHRENIMNQYGQNKNYINSNSGFQNLNINNNIDNNNKNSNEKNTNKEEISIIAPVGVPVGPVEEAKVIPVKRVEYECPMCHEEYGGAFFHNSNFKGYYDDKCRKCNSSIYDVYHFRCDKCSADFCDNCSKI